MGIEVIPPAVENMWRKLPMACMKKLPLSSATVLGMPQALWKKTVERLVKGKTAE